MKIKKLKAHKGFTIIELIIVFALIAVVTAIIAPNFFKTTDKVKAKSDIQSAKIIKNAIKLYESETGSLYVASVTMVKDLKDKGYLDVDSLTPQTTDATWEYDATTKTVKVNFKGKLSPEAKASLSAEEKLNIIE